MSVKLDFDPWNKLFSKCVVERNGIKCTPTCKS